MKKNTLKPMFVTQWMEENLRRRAVFNCGHEQVLLWGMPSPEDVKDIADRLKFVSAAVIDRVDAEFEARLHFRCFDVEAVRKAFECDDIRQTRSLQQGLQREMLPAQRQKAA